ncbi:MAG TPA: hypothetical protein VM935_01005 [Chitinophagaceae bacterium]|jgi:LPS O-antigen subunit length determinant protein (WzzB/FepE family)|nr:hypothetical protein [Chitinophagaceae bacterium]
MKKILVLAIAGTFTTATLVYATVASEKKVKKEVVTKKDSKCTKSSKRSCIF